MQRKWPWFERHFEFNFPAEKMPDIIERLQGTPFRVEAVVAGFDNADLERRETEASWSVKENIGHLADLEPLWSGRIQDILEGKEFMREADLTNRPTFAADHNQRSVAELVASFRDLRRQLVQTARDLDNLQWSATALHPRLKTPMRIVDLCQFVADHDDYHLSRIRYLTSLVGD